MCTECCGMDRLTGTNQYAYTLNILNEYKIFSKIANRIYLVLWQSKHLMKYLIVCNLQEGHYSSDVNMTQTSARSLYFVEGYVYRLDD